MKHSHKTRVAAVAGLLQVTYRAPQSQRSLHIDHVACMCVSSHHHIITSSHHHIITSAHTQLLLIDTLNKQ